MAAPQAAPATEPPPPPAPPAAAAVAAAEAPTPAPPQQASPAPPAPPAPPQPLDEETLRSLVCGMLSQDPDVLRATVSRHYAPGAVLYHYLVAARSAEDVYRVYRAYTAGFISRPVIREVIIDTRQQRPAGSSSSSSGASGGNGSSSSGAAMFPVVDHYSRQSRHLQPPGGGGATACVWLDQHVRPKLPLTTGVPLLGPLLPEAVIPTLVVIRTRPDPETGRPLVYEQYDHISLYALVWSFGWPALVLFERLFKPAAMYAMGATAWALDALEECRRFAALQLGLGWLLPAATATAWQHRHYCSSSSSSAPGSGISSCHNGGGGIAGGRSSTKAAACGEAALKSSPDQQTAADGSGGGGGGGGGIGGALGKVVGPAVAAVAAARELPGELDHSATDFGLRGKQLDGTDTTRAAATTEAAALSSGDTAAADNAKPLPPVAVR